jgi:hypothetical protein
MTVAHVVAESRSRPMTLAGRRAEARVSPPGRPLTPRER